MLDHGERCAVRVAGQRERWEQIAEFGARDPRLPTALAGLVADLVALDQDAALPFAAVFDVVAVDAPCSGLGTLRRNPDLKWRQTPEGVADLVRKQQEILSGAARLVKAGGRVVYATCSLLPPENEDVLAAFLAAPEDFLPIFAAHLMQPQQIPLEPGAALRPTPLGSDTHALYAGGVGRHK